MKKQDIRVIISGGGTGGHVFPAISIANAIKELQPDAEFLFVGAKGKLEMEKVPEAGYPIKGLWISGFHRKLTWRNLLFPVRLISSLFKAFWIIRRFKPSVVVGVGGYASWPVLEVASRLKIPTLIQEQNSYAGVTNKILAQRVSRVCVAYDNMEKYFPKEKILLTGNPVRKGLNPTSDVRSKAYATLDLDPGKKTIFVFGGSLGARTINEAMAAGAKVLADHKDTVQVFWQSGKLYWDAFKDSPTAQLDSVRITAFVNRMDLAYAIADVVICRAGALAIAELALVGKPAVLVPSPNVAEDHQTKNAMALVEKGAAVMVRDREASPKMLDEAMKIIQDDAVRSSLQRSVTALARPDAALEIGGAVIQLVQH